jgi:hypothetical protein
MAILAIWGSWVLDPISLLTGFVKPVKYLFWGTFTPPFHGIFMVRDSPKPSILLRSRYMPFKLTDPETRRDHLRTWTEGPETLEYPILDPKLTHFQTPQNDISRKGAQNLHSRVPQIWTPFEQKPSRGPPK